MMLAELERLSHLLGESWSPTDQFKQATFEVRDELQLVRSGLDDTMREALQAMRTKWHEDKRVEDLRLAAYLIAVEKIALSYHSKSL